MNDLYIALDFSNGREALDFLESNQLGKVPVKIGMELFYREGPLIVEQLHAREHPIFLDLKLHDIPATVYRTMRHIGSMEVDMVNVHALGGSDMIHAARKGLDDGSRTAIKPLLLAVTILTSIDDAMVEKELHMDGDAERNAIHLARLSQANGADGVVCSAHEAGNVKAICGNAFQTVTPGIRLNETPHPDQKRSASPSEARRMGADIAIIGRSITHAASPQQAYLQAREEWKNDNE